MISRQTRQRALPYRGTAICLLLFLAAMGLTVPVSAETFTVNSPGDDLGLDVGNGRCETAPGNGVCTLRRAMAEVWGLTTFAGSSATMSILLDVPGGRIDLQPGLLAMEGGPVVELNILSASAAETIIDAHGNRVFSFVYCSQSNVRIVGVHIQNASMAMDGCATLSLVRSQISDSQTAFRWSGDATLTDCVLARNGSQTGFPVQISGGTASLAGPTLRLRRTVLRDNRAGSGGAIYALVGIVDLDGVTFTANQATGAGGAVYISEYSQLRAVNTTFSGNTAGSHGGAVYVRAPLLPGARNEIAFSTLTGNRADGDANGDGVGGGILAEVNSNLTIRNSIISANVQTALVSGTWTPTPGDCWGAVTTAGTSLFGVAHCTVSGTTPLLGDANLGPLQDNGGPTPTHAPQIGSAAIDAGPAVCVFESAAVVRDQRGLRRLSGSACDLGALEVGATVIAKGRPRDLNGDGRSDLVWRHGTGLNAMWLMNGATPIQGSMLPRVGDTSWDIVASDDFDGDGAADLLWQRSNGQLAIWFMSATGLREGTYLPPLWENGWRLVGAGDFDNDERADLLWKNGSQTMIWLLDGALVRAVHRPGNVDPNVSGFVGDVNGDHKVDVVWRHPVFGTHLVWLMNGASVDSFSLLQAVVSNSTWELRALADIDGDERADAVWHDATVGQTAVWFLSGASIRSAGYLPMVNKDEWRLSAVEDTDGDGRADLFWRSNDGRVARWGMNGLTLQTGAIVGSVADPSWDLE